MPTKKNIIIPPKTKWGSWKEISFSELTQTDNEGKKIDFSESWEASDGGQFEKNLYTRIDIDIVLSNLPRKEGQALRLRREGYSRKEIANEMGTKPNAVKQLIYRAYGKIKNMAG